MKHSLDNKYTPKILRTLLLCQKYYTDSQLAHVIRVANLTLNNPLMIGLKALHYDEELIYCYALCHDLLEDTKATIEEIATALEERETKVEVILKLLTHNKTEMNYIEYIQKIYNADSIGSEVAYFIKLADMKDHLLQKDTLTDKLKEKYWEALPYLL
jgi:(p)ppGpp synthase/HD superfamily hydrolase